MLFRLRGGVAIPPSPRLHCPPKIPYVGFSPVRLQFEARLRQPCPARGATTVKRQACIPLVAARFDMACVSCGPSCGIVWRYQLARLGPQQHPPRPTASSLRRGYVVPSIHAFRPDLPDSVAPPDFPRTLVIPAAVPDDLVWAAAEFLPALGQRSVHTCHHLYAGKRTRVHITLRLCSHGLPSSLTESAPPSLPTSASVGAKVLALRPVSAVLRPAWLLALLDRSDPKSPRSLAAEDIHSAEGP